MITTEAGSRRQTDFLSKSQTSWWASLVAQSVKNLPAVQETQVGSLGWEDPMEKEMSVFLPGKSHGQKSLEGLQCMGVAESDTT